MEQLIRKRDSLEATLQDVVPKIKSLNDACASWRESLCDTYNNDTSWWNNASEWLRKEVSVTIDWLDHIMDWADHYIELLSRMYKLVSDEYDSYTEEELNSTIKISQYLDKSTRRADLAAQWYDIASTLYENFTKVLSGEYTAEAVDEIVRYDNQLFEQLGEVANEFDDNSDHYWVKK